MKYTFTIACLLLLSTTAHAQCPQGMKCADLPGKPKPAGREFWIQTAAMSASWANDAVSTAHVWNNCPTCVENGYIFPGSRSLPKVMGTWAAVDVGAAILSYEWKRHVHNRWLHPLWRAPLLSRIDAHNEVAIHNWRLDYYKGSR